MLRCRVCDEPISEERIKVFIASSGNPPDTCVKHASPVKPIGFMVYGHKTAGEVLIVDGSDKEALRQANRAYRRSR